MIPKIIHYIWIGEKKLNHTAHKCIKSWGKFCPQFQIMHWDENNLPINEFSFSKEAYKQHKYAFVSDIMRLYVLNKYGGIYLDTDTEIIKPIDKLLQNECFFGFEDNKYASCGIIGCSLSNKHIYALFNIYSKKDFNINNLDNDTIPINVTKYFIHCGLKQTGVYQVVDGCTFYQSDFFYPKNIETGIIHKTINTYTIHHWAASWADKKLIRKRKISQFFIRHKLIKYILLPFNYIRKLCWLIIFKIKNKFSD